MGQANQRKSALIVEHDEDQRFLLGTLFEESGFEVIECETAEAALAVMESKPGIAVLFTDIRLAGVRDGVDLAHEVMRRWPNTSVIATSDRSSRVAELPRGVTYLQKPWRPLDLLVQVERAAH